MGKNLLMAISLAMTAGAAASLIAGKPEATQDCAYVDVNHITLDGVELSQYDGSGPFATDKHYEAMFACSDGYQLMKTATKLISPVVCDSLMSCTTH